MDYKIRGNNPGYGDGMAHHGVVNSGNGIEFHDQSGGYENPNSHSNHKYLPSTEYHGNSSYQPDGHPDIYGHSGGIATYGHSGDFNVLHDGHQLGSSSNNGEPKSGYNLAHDENYNDDYSENQEVSCTKQLNAHACSLQNYP